MKITTLLCTHNLSLGRELGTRALVLGPDHTHGGSEHTHAHLHDWA
ncbi:MAG: hypothetical protein IE886_02700 [Campylobacterales bacterium]|nr:hypothetical protein [Campylobacterales bacterium]